MLQSVFLNGSNVDTASCYKLFVSYIIFTVVHTFISYRNLRKPYMSHVRGHDLFKYSMTRYCIQTL